MTLYRDRAVSLMPDIAPDESCDLADAIADLLYALDMELPMEEQLKAINRLWELTND